jgi:hypothetical protein
MVLAKQTSLCLKLTKYTLGTRNLADRVALQRTATSTQGFIQMLLLHSHIGRWFGFILPIHPNPAYRNKSDDVTVYLVDFNLFLSIVSQTGHLDSQDSHRFSCMT